MGYGYLLKNDIVEKTEELIQKDSEDTIVEKAKLYLEDVDNSFAEDLLRWKSEKGYLSKTQLFHLARFVVNMEAKYE